MIKRKRTVGIPISKMQKIDATEANSAAGAFLLRDGSLAQIVPDEFDLINFLTLLIPFSVSFTHGHFPPGVLAVNRPRGNSSSLL